jgi:predicted RNA-binding protein with RPS1 domain
VSNVAQFGAFVDLGVHQDGLIHVSQLANKFVEDAREVVKTGDIVKVKVLEVDLGRNRISLTMKLDAAPARRDGPRENRFEGAAEGEKAIVIKIEGNKAPALKAVDVIVQIDPRYYRPTEVETLLGDPTKAKEKLGWVPEITLDQMIVEMVANDLDQAKQHALLLQHGHSVSVGKEN